MQVFKWTLHRPRPIDIYHGVSSWGFPSGHTTMSVVIYGFLAVLLLRSFRSGWRWIPFVFALGFSLLIAFSRIYLGAHWLSDVLGGMALGWVWVTLLGAIYFNHTADDSSMRRLLPVTALVFLVLLIAGSWHIASQHSADMEKYRVQVPIHILNEEDWLNQGFRQLPAWRYTLFGDREQPLTLQLAGNTKQLAKLLKSKGWQDVEKINAKQLLNPFVSHISIKDLPLLPHLSGGRQEALLLVKNESGKRLVLRLWPTSYRLKSSAPLWVGTVESEKARPLANLLTLPMGNKDFDAALSILKRDLSPLFFSPQLRSLDLEKSGSGDWSGEILLIDAPTPVGDVHSPATSVKR